MVASTRPGRPGVRSSSWNYSNANSFTDDAYSAMTFYDSPPSSPAQPHYATLPRNFRNANSKKRSRGSEAPPPYAAMEMLLEDYSHQHHYDADSGYSSGAASPEPLDDCPPTPTQPSILIHPAIHHRKPTAADYYYYLPRPTANPASPSYEHGLALDPSNPSISFTCTMQPCSPLSPQKKKKRRRITNNDISKPDADPLTYIRDNCENAARALSSHRKLHNCDCDFAFLDNRDRNTGSVWRRGEVDGLRFGPQRPCRKRWFTGWFVRQHMKFHDQYCACGCFGDKR